MKGSCPLIPAFRVFRPSLTSRSLPLYFPSMVMLMSTSLIVWSHLYGSAACSACSFARASASAFFCSSGGGEPDILTCVVVLSKVLQIHGLFGGETSSGLAASSHVSSRRPWLHSFTLTSKHPPRRRPWASLTSIDNAIPPIFFHRAVMLP
jgi:hypothetical protein